MRPLNRPMFKMGGPVKEGVMEGIKEPQATFGVGNNANRDPKTGREKHAVFVAAGIPAALTAARVAIPTALRAAASRLPAFLRPTAGQVTGGGGLRTASEYARTRMAPMSALEKFRSIPFVARDPLLMGLTGPTGSGLGGKILRGVKGTLSYGLTSPTGLATSALFFPGPQIAKGLFGGDDKPEEIVKKSNVGQVGKKGEDTKVEKTGADANQFDDDGTKKSTSVDRLLKSVVTRARRDAAADTAIKFGQQLRTGEASIKDPSSVIDVASQEFDKVSDLQKKVDLARIENELKKQQIKEQALATDKYIRAASATGKPVDFVARKSLGIPTSISETTAIFEKAQPGFTKTSEGTQIVAKEWADTEGINFQGSLGGDDDLKKANKIEEFKLNPESFILEKIEELDGNDGLYVFGTNVFEYNNGVVKKIKN